MTEMLIESLRSCVAKTNLLLPKNFDAFRELTKLCCKKTFAVAKTFRLFQRAYQVVLQKEIGCWKKS